MSGDGVSDASVLLGELNTGLVDVPPAAARGESGERDQGNDGERDESHAPTLRLSHGDVDPDGEVVDRLRPAVCPDSAIDVDEHLAGVVRMLARRAS